MRSPVIFALVALALLGQSCSEKKPETLKVLVDSFKTNQTDSAEVKRLLQIVEGGWVDTVLAGAIERKKSVRAGYSEGLNEAEFYFDISSLSGDTLINSRGRSFYHESERFDIIFRKNLEGKPFMEIYDGRNFASVKIMLNYIFTGNDTLLSIFNSRLGAQGVYKRVFRKPPSRNEVDITALEYLVNKTLFEGVYKLTTGKYSQASDTVSFAADGTVKGFQGLTWYRVETDFGHGNAPPFDMVMLSNEEGMPFPTFAFERKGNVLFLYAVKNASGEGMPSREKLVYRLERIK
ncbi:MAG: hypothetical protein FD123_1376 [Bacteroidetes bacterium]|nr:MAG: hypothetical protein FD123_1376 [Bacteroidota bacterium]